MKEEMIQNLTEQLKSSEDSSKELVHLRADADASRDEIGRLTDALATAGRSAAEQYQAREQEAQLRYQQEIAHLNNEIERLREGSAAFDRMAEDIKAKEQLLTEATTEMEAQRSQILQLTESIKLFQGHQLQEDVLMKTRAELESSVTEIEHLSLIVQEKESALTRAIESETQLRLKCDSLHKQLTETTIQFQQKEQATEQELNELKTAIQHRDETLRASQQEFLRHQQDFSQLKSQVSALHSEAQSKSHEIERLRQQLTERETELAQHDSLAGEQSQQLQGRLDQLLYDLSAMDEQRKTAVDEANRLQMELENEIQKSQQVTTETDRRFKDAEQRASDLEQQLASQQQRVSQMESSIQEQQKLFAEKEAAIQKEKAETSSSVSQLNTLRQTVEDLTLQLDSTRVELETLKTTEQQQNDLVNDLHRQIELQGQSESQQILEMRSNLDSLRAAMDEAQSDRRSLETRIAQQTDHIASLEHTCNSLKVELAAQLDKEQEIIVAHEKQEASLQQELDQVRQTCTSMTDDIKQVQSEKVRLLEKLESERVQSKQNTELSTQEVDRLRHELQDYVSRFESLNAEKNRLLESLQQSQSRIVVLEQSVNEITQAGQASSEKEKMAIDQMTRELERTRNDNNALTTSQKDLEQQISKMKAKWSILENERDQLKSRITGFEEEKQKTNETFRDRIQALEAALSSDKSVYEKQIVGFAEDKQTLLRDVEDKTRQIQQLRQAIDSQQQTHSKELKSTIEEVEKLNDVLRQSKDALQQIEVVLVKFGTQASMQGLQGAYAEGGLPRRLETVLDNVLDWISSAQDAQSFLNEEIKQLRMTVQHQEAAFGNEKTRLQADKEQLSKECAEARMKLDELQQKMEKRKQELVDTRDALKKAKLFKDELESVQQRLQEADSLAIQQKQDFAQLVRELKAALEDENTFLQTDLKTWNQNEVSAIIASVLVRLQVLFAEKQHRVEDRNKSVEELHSKLSRREEAFALSEARNLQLTEDRDELLSQRRTLEEQ
jgi:chromosome segregation ATPase